MEIELSKKEQSRAELIKLATKLSDDYNQDNNNKVQLMIEQINQRWGSVSNRMSDYASELEQANKDIENFDADFEELAKFIDEVEPKLNDIEKNVEKISDAPTTPSTPLRGSLTGSNSLSSPAAAAPAVAPHLDDQTVSNTLTAAKDLETEIDARQEAFNRMNISGQRILRQGDSSLLFPADGGAGSAGAKSVSAGGGDMEHLQRRLNEINQRWLQLKTKSVEIRSRLEKSTEKWNKLSLTLNELVEWVASVETSLHQLRPVSGDLHLVEKQINQLQNDVRIAKNLRMELDQRRPLVEHSLRTGRKYLKAEDQPGAYSGRAATGDEVANLQSSSSPSSILVSIKQMVRLLDQKWPDIDRRVTDTQRRAEASYNHLEELIESLESLAATIKEIDTTVSEQWDPVGDLVTQNLPRELDQLRTFQLKISPMQGQVDNLNDLYSNLSGLGVQLSPTHVALLTDTNKKWRSLQVTIDRRLKELEKAVKNYGPDSQHYLSASVTPPWERAVAATKVPYFINHDSESTHWDHPQMTDFFHNLSDINNVKFSAYRTAMKLRALQKLLRLDLISLQKAILAFEKQGLHAQNDRCIGVLDVIKTMSLLYEQVQNDHPELVTVPTCVDLVLNWLLNVYDISRTGQMRLLSFKVAVALLTEGHLEDKYRYIFRLIADKDGVADQKKMGILLHDCMQIPRQLGEIAAFGGSNIEPSVRSCFQMAAKNKSSSTSGSGGLTVSEKSVISIRDFLNWLKREPQSLVWLPVLHRVAASESVKHQAKCSICKQLPIVGFRYRCLRCFNFDMCQNCFFSGRRAKHHKSNHPMQEYCSATTSGEDVRDFTRVLKNKFRSKSKLRKQPLSYLPVQSVLEGAKLESPNVAGGPGLTSNTPGTGVASYMTNSTDDVHARIELFAHRLAQLDKSGQSTDGGAGEKNTTEEDEHTLIAQYCQSLNGPATGIGLTSHGEREQDRSAGNLSSTGASRTGSFSSAAASGSHLRSPVQIMMAVDSDQKGEVETMIKALEEENKNLLKEYERLKTAKSRNADMAPYNSASLPPPNSAPPLGLENGNGLHMAVNGVGGGSGGVADADYSATNGNLSDYGVEGVDSQDEDILAEARLLRQHKGRLEARMQILEDHNRQLEAQLQRLRLLLNTPSDADSSLTGAESTSTGNLSTDGGGRGTGVKANVHDPISPRTPRMGDRASMERHPPSYSSSNLNGGVGADFNPASSNFSSSAFPYTSRTVATSRSSAATKNVGNLFHMAGEVSKAVGSLVTCMTDESADEMSQQPFPPTQSSSSTTTSHGLPPAHQPQFSSSSTTSTNNAQYPVQSGSSDNTQQQQHPQPQQYPDYSNPSNHDRNSRLTNDKTGSGEYGANSSHPLAAPGVNDSVGGPPPPPPPAPASNGSNNHHHLLSAQTGMGESYDSSASSSSRITAVEAAAASKTTSNATAE